MNEFPLAQWFDTSKPISKVDADEAEAQMALYAVKDGLDPKCKEAKSAYRQMRMAVKHHNQSLRNAAAKP